MDNLGEMDKFLEIYNLLTLNQEEIEDANELINSNKGKKERKKQKEKISQQAKMQDQVAS